MSSLGGSSPGFGSNKSLLIQHGSMGGGSGRWKWELSGFWIQQVVHLMGSDGAKDGHDDDTNDDGDEDNDDDDDDDAEDNGDDDDDDDDDDGDDDDDDTSVRTPHLQ